MYFACSGSRHVKFARLLLKIDKSASFGSKFRNIFIFKFNKQEDEVVDDDNSMMPSIQVFTLAFNVSLL